ncbi:MAG: calcium-binding protein [Archangium sp.]|nr:calcium-binding protein [Archangium sp.]
MKTLRSTLFSLSLAAVGFGCNGALSEDDSMVGEASAALTVAEESGDATADVAGAESDDEASISADEAAEVPEVPTEGDGVCDLGARRERVLQRYDADGSGRLEAAERQALKSDLAARVGHPVLARFGLRHRIHVAKRLRFVFDENGDHSLSTEERTALVDALEARCQRIRATVLERFDANHDDTLDATERQAAKAAFIARVQAARANVLAEYDSNDSGTLEPIERLKLRSDRLAAFRERRSEVVAKFDADGNGSLSDAEKLALKQAIQLRIIEGRDAE